MLNFSPCLSSFCAGVVAKPFCPRVPSSVVTTSWPWTFDRSWLMRV